MDVHTSPGSAGPPPRVDREPLVRCEGGDRVRADVAVGIRIVPPASAREHAEDLLAVGIGAREEPGDPVAHTL